VKAGAFGPAAHDFVFLHLHPLRRAATAILISRELTALSAAAAD